MLLVNFKKFPLLYQSPYINFLYKNHSKIPGFSWWCWWIWVAFIEAGSESAVASLQLWLQFVFVPYLCNLFYRNQILKYFYHFSFFFYFLCQSKSNQTKRKGLFSYNTLPLSKPTLMGVSWLDFGILANIFAWIASRIVKWAAPETVVVAFSFQVNALWHSDSAFAAWQLMRQQYFSIWWGVWHFKSH